MSTSSNFTQTVKDHATNIGQQAKDTATQHVKAQAEEAQGRAADRIAQAAQAADAAADELDPASPQAQAVQQVADYIEDAADKIRQADIGQLAANVNDMARRNPMLFIGGAAIAGFAAARFLKSREPQPTQYARGADPWDTYPHGNDPDTSVMTKLNGAPDHA